MPHTDEPLRDRDVASPEDVDASEITEEEPPGPPAAPTAGAERIRSLDLLRGFAVLGILLVNIWSFGLPFPAALNPNLAGLDAGADRVAHWLVHMLAWSKTMPIFSMLFGAGVVLFTTRLIERGHKPRGLFYRRQFWLLILGLAHAYLLWDGDILVPYAVVGMILYLFRNRRPRTLVVLAVLAMIVPKATMTVGAHFMEEARVEGLELEAAVAAGDSLSVEDETKLEMLREQRAMWSPSAEEYDAVVDRMRSGWGTISSHRAEELVGMHLFFYPMATGWNIAGYMLLGMALFKTGVLRGERSNRFYVWMIALGYGVGLPGSAAGFFLLEASGADFAPVLRVGFPVINTAGGLVALGHIGLIVLLHRTGRLAGIEARVSAAGRMAFTNYLACTVIGTTLFYGYGAGLFGVLGRAELFGVVILMWAAMLLWSKPWLERYRFGPAEWVWRSLTYRGRQPLRRGSRP